MKLVDGRWIAEGGDFQFQGLWYPDGEIITKSLAHQLRHEPFYNCDRFHDAMRLLRRFRGAVECGAHVGAWSRELARRFERVVAIELNPASARCLRANLAPFPNATVVNCALGDRSGEVRVAAAKGSLDSEVRPGAADPPTTPPAAQAPLLGQEGSEWEVVPMRALDEVLDGAAIGSIDYLKVHVNGYEVPVLRGARETIARHKPLMTVVIKKALANYGARPEDVFNLMGEMGYRVVSRLKPYWVFSPPA